MLSSPTADCEIAIADALARFLGEILLCTIAGIAPRPGGLRAKQEDDSATTRSGPREQQISLSEEAASTAWWPGS